MSGPGHMRNAIIMLSAAMSVTLLVGCVPAITRDAPQITGKVTIDGVPTKGVVVIVQKDANAPCGQSSNRTTADERGYFKVPTGHRFEVLAPLQDFRRFNWRLCFDYGGRVFAGYAGAGDMPAPSKVRLQCELSTGESDESVSASPLGICRLQES
jgi:hypothetical protein